MLCERKIVVENMETISIRTDCEFYSECNDPKKNWNFCSNKVYYYGEMRYDCKTNIRRKREQPLKVADFL